MRTKKFGLLLGCLAATKAFAFMGVGDVVIVASNPAQEMLWASEELPKWMEMISKAEQQVKQTQEMVNVVGHAKDFAGNIVNTAKPALSLVKEASTLKRGQDVLDLTRSTWKLASKTSADVSSDVLTVPEKVTVFGNEVARDRDRYVGLASEKAMRGRVKQALENQHKVDVTELELQEQTLQQLSAATTQSEIALLQATLAASKQRMDFAAAQTKQAQDELQNLTDDQALEKRKDAELESEKAQKVTSELYARAQRAADVGLEILELK
ncbi:MAG TPA: hypothetical protein VFT72_19430 [Opitutaceae bacterium]|nr:hypothetical protein [Opitutaceae bacterium]